jgi:hypothetical protein
VPYTDARGRPELIMHPDIVRGRAAFRGSGPEPTEPPDAALTSVPPLKTPKGAATPGARSAASPPQ